MSASGSHPLDTNIAIAPDPRKEMVLRWLAVTAQFFAFTNLDKMRNYNIT